MKKQKLLAVALGVVFLLVIAYRCLTFPVLGWHSQACLCAECLERYDDDRPEVRDADR